MESAPLLGSAERPEAVRWYLMVLVSCIGFMQGLVWNNFGPIAPVVQPLLGWSNGTIALLANWGPICYLIAVLPTSWLIDFKGLRPTMLVAAGLVFSGCLVRSFTWQLPLCTYLCHIGHFFNGLAGPVAMAAAPTFSATWFPATQRTTATAIISAANYLGVALSFVLGPLLLPPHEGDDVLPLPEHVVRERHRQLDLYMWIQTGMSGLTLLLILVYFPSQPRRRPSISAGHERIDFIEGWKQLLGHGQFWLIAGSYGIITGVYAGWTAYLAPNLKHVYHDKAESIAAWLGFWATVAGCVGGISFGFAIDTFGGKMKLWLILLSFGSAVAYGWFTFMCIQSFSFMPLSSWGAYTSNILGGLFINGAIPLYYETAVEATFPIAEASTTGLLTTVNNIGCLLFLVPPEFPQLGNAWVNWALLGSCCAAFVLIQFFRESYARKSMDLGTDFADDRKDING